MTAAKHAWRFKSRFRRNAFGWRSQPALKRVNEAVAEIKKVARTEPLLAAEGAVVFLERVSPALENVDSSSGAIGSAVNRAVEELCAIIAAAPADPKTRDAWLERLYEAHANDAIPYIESLADHWGDLCGSRETAGAWVDRLVGTTKMALSPDKNTRGHFHGTTMCLTAMMRAERYDEIDALLEHTTFWHYKRYAVLATAKLGKRSEAIALAESLRGAWTPEWDVARICEDILIASGRVEEAFERYASAANGATTFVAWFRNVAKKYPHKEPREVLTLLVSATPGDEGKWFAAAKDAGLYEEAIALAKSTPCDPRTLARAARDFAAKKPAFAMAAGLAALDWLAQGYGYEITGADVFAALVPARAAAAHLGQLAELEAHVDRIGSRYSNGDNIVARLTRPRSA